MGGGGQFLVVEDGCDGVTVAFPKWLRLCLEEDQNDPGLESGWAQPGGLRFWWSQQRNGEVDSGWVVVRMGQTEREGGRSRNQRSREPEGHLCIQNSSSNCFRVPGAERGAVSTMGSADRQCLRTLSPVVPGSTRLGLCFIRAGTGVGPDLSES